LSPSEPYAPHSHVIPAERSESRDLGATAGRSKPHARHPLRTSAPGSRVCAAPLRAASRTGWQNGV